MSRMNFTKLSKHLLQLVVVRAFWQTLHEEVEEAALLLGALVLPHVEEDLHFFAA